MWQRNKSKANDNTKIILLLELLCYLIRNAFTMKESSVYSLQNFFVQNVVRRKRGSEPATAAWRVGAEPLRRRQGPGEPPAAEVRGSSQRPPSSAPPEHRRQQRGAAEPAELTDPDAPLAPEKSGTGSDQPSGEHRVLRLLLPMPELKQLLSFHLLPSKRPVEL